MKKIVIALLSVAAVLGGVEAAALQGGGGITGVWATGSQGGQVEIYRCGTVLCGRIIDAAPLRANPDQRDVKNPEDRKSVVKGKSVSGRVALGGRRIIKKKKKIHTRRH